MFLLLRIHPPTSSKMITSEFDYELYLLNMFNI